MKSHIYIIKVALLIKIRDKKINIFSRFFFDFISCHYDSFYLLRIVFSFIIYFVFIVSIIRKVVAIGFILLSFLLALYLSFFFYYI